MLAHLIGSALESAEYSAEVYYEALILMGGTAVFDSEHAIYAQECIFGLAEYPDIIMERYKYIL